MSKNTRPIRAYDPDRLKLLDLSREISLIEKNDVKVPEVLRRSLNIPNLKEQLIKDAEIKRIKRYGM